MTDDQTITGADVATVDVANLAIIEQPVPKYAFRCNNCNSLETSANAGERDFPAKCPTCGKGVRFDPDTGVKSYDESNWTVLADLDGPDKDGVFEYHAITDADIERHVPATPPEDADPNHVPQSIEVQGEGSAAGAVDNTGAQA